MPISKRKDQIKLISFKPKTALGEFIMNSKKIEWQVGYESDYKPTFGIDMFDNENEAKKHAETLSKQGEQGVTLTKFIDTAPIQTWKLKTEVWQPI